MSHANVQIARGIEIREFRVAAGGSATDELRLILFIADSLHALRRSYSWRIRRRAKCWLRGLHMQVIMGKGQRH
ncbi:hypothetical protein DPV79_23565 [Burkholderia reimsis]|uniref:Uncharacterized protein n=1 Tax=Burkholderia reimsis TaxID=2234132 RepID=A0A365QR06_9BURK|nr:hypothetical protein DPV79_23565 [Burkholderia reimsis]